MEAINVFFDFIFSQLVAFAEISNFLFTEEIIFGLTPIALISVSGLITYLGIAITMWIVK